MAPPTNFFNGRFSYLPVTAERFLDAMRQSVSGPLRRNQDVRFRAAVGGQADVDQGTGRADQCLTCLTQKSPSFAAGFQWRDAAADDGARKVLAPDAAGNSALELVLLLVCNAAESSTLFGAPVDIARGRCRRAS
jgi:hypothetical protein